MPQAQAAAGGVAGLSLLRRFRGSANRVRVTTIVCLVLICGSFASTGAIEMRNDRARAVAQATAFGARRAEEIAADLGATLDRYAAIGSAFANAATSPETSAALAEAGGAALRNIVVLDANGAPQSEMLRTPGNLLPLEPNRLAAAHGRRIAFASHDGQSLLLLSAANQHLVLVQIDPARLFREAGMADAALATPSGRLLALGSGWREAPAPASLALGHATSDSRRADLPSGTRLLSLAKLPRWPLIAVASHPLKEALGAWYGALPLYFFFILGPSVAGAALAVVFVRLFEKQARAAAALQSLRSTKPDEARLLVRLADAERRAAESERAKSRFIAQVSHELRTPLNAIIGFAESIESGVFGAPGHPKYVEYARDIAEAGRELHTKIGSVLEFAAVQRGRDDAPSVDRAAAVDVAELARTKFAERAAGAQARGLKLVLSAPEAAFARGDANTIARILAHLLDNALAYTPKGGTVRLEIRADGREVLIGVRDTGEGFSTGERLRAGEPFQRFPRKASRGGMGMGLAIAMGLARRVGATISVSSVSGDGTLALLRLSAADK
ncbi:MAG TPA: HAMP domain-containing sensor histidine kinase [Rhizomicrobium sp.]|jgi:signal transduction histidine kinase|nr:HAMP domain-containing sensor histidine kinase [Rhizomicrobium sp.]